MPGETIDKRALEEMIRRSLREIQATPTPRRKELRLAWRHLRRAIRIR